MVLFEVLPVTWTIVVCGRAYAYRVGPTLVWPFCRSCHACVGSLCGTFPAYCGFFYRNENGIRTGENERCISSVTGQLERVLGPGFLAVRYHTSIPPCRIVHVGVLTVLSSLSQSRES